MPFLFTKTADSFENNKMLTITGCPMSSFFHYGERPLTANCWSAHHYSGGLVIHVLFEKSILEISWFSCNFFKADGIQKLLTFSCIKIVLKQAWFWRSHTSHLMVSWIGWLTADNQWVGKGEKAPSPPLPLFFCFPFPSILWCMENLFLLPATQVK